MVQHISQVLNRFLAPYFMYDTTTKEWQQHESYSRRNSLSYSTFVVVRTTLKTGHQSLLQARVVHALSLRPRGGERLRWALAPLPWGRLST